MSESKQGLSREEEAEILQKLCGWRRMRHVNGTYAVMFSPTADVDDDFLDWWKPVDASVELVDDDLPPISIDEKAATRHIVPALQAKGLELVVSWPVDDRPRAQIFRVPGPMALFSEQGDCAAEAICRAVKSYLAAQQGGE